MNTLKDIGYYLWSFQRDGVHAVSSADVPGIQPVNFQTTCWSMFPTEEVRMQYTASVAVRRVTNSYSQNNNNKVIWKNFTKNNNNFRFSHSGSLKYDFKKQEILRMTDMNLDYSLYSAELR